MVHQLSSTHYEWLRLFTPVFQSAKMFTNDRSDISMTRENLFRRIEKKFDEYRIVKSRRNSSFSILDIIQVG